MSKKLRMPLIVLLFISVSQISYSRARIPIPFGTEQKIIKVMDFPDTEMFRLEDSSYFDLGSMYTKKHIVWLSYSNSEPILVGFVEGKDGEEVSYLDLTPEVLGEIGKLPDITLPTEGRISFFDKIIGKFLLGLIVLGIFYGLYLQYFKKEDKTQE